MVRGALAVVVGVGLLGLSYPVAAKSGTHPLVISTWDARASSITLGYRHGFTSGGGFNDVAYTANFSSTTGIVSAQFGLHYENLIQRDIPTLHGLAATATAVFDLPLTPRHDDGLPTLALAPFIGAAPTGLVSGSINYITIPIVLGFGMPVTPAKFVTLTPWVEVSPAVNLDPEFKPYQLSPQDAAKIIDPKTGQVKLTQAEVQTLITQSTDLKASVGAGFRGGLNLALRLSPAVDVAADFAISSIGTAFAGPTVYYVGGGFVWRWDDFVPAVLPPEQRLVHEDCDAIEARFRMCPNSERWKPPPAEPATKPGAVPPSPAAATVPAPAPAAPAPSPSPQPPTNALPAQPAGTGTFPP
jgi:hypothetical protein